MHRPVTVFLVVAVAAGNALAAESPASSEAAASPDAPTAAEAPTSPEYVRKLDEYVGRVIEMENTAEAHVEVARWCAENGMADRARVHWQEALFRDPDQAEAREARGFVKRGDTWYPVDEAPPPERKPDGPPGPSPGERRIEIARRVREIYRTLLDPADPERWRKGAVELLKVRDEVGAGPVAQILGTGAVEHRVLACRVLAGIPGDEATSYLLGFVLADEADEVHLEAMNGLATRLDERVVNQLAYAVSRGREETMQRAAHALGHYGSWDAVPALIANLRTPYYRTVYDTEIRYPPPIRGGAIPFVAGVRPIVGRHVVAQDPIIGYVTAGGVRIPEYEYPREVVVRKTVKEYHNQPIVREALVEITDQDFGYDQAAWRRWWRGRLPQRGPPPKVPLR